MENPLIARGTRYEGDTTFDGFEVLASPVAEREDRIFGQLDSKPGTGTCYQSHSIKLAKQQGDKGYKGNVSLFILMEHGGGREVWKISTFYDRGDLQHHILALPERLQYALLYTIYNIASEASRAAAAEESSTYAKAFLEGRLKKSRIRQGRRSVFIEPPSTASTH